MTDVLIAAEIARRIPDMAGDSLINNEQTILNLIRQMAPTAPLVSHGMPPKHSCEHWVVADDVCIDCGVKISAATS